MKTLILMLLGCMLQHTAVAQKNHDAILVTASIISVSPQSEEHLDIAYTLRIKIFNTSGDSVLKGDTILLSAKDNSDLYTIYTYISEKNLPKDSSMEISVKEKIESGSFTKSGMLMRHDYSATFKRGTQKPVTYTALIDMTKFFPWLDLYVPMMRLTDIDFYPALSQLNFKYYGTKASSVLWVITDNSGRRVSHGYLDVRKGTNTYMIMADNLRAGRYTLSIGDGSDEMDGTFTVLR
jgi:hypothetical protein